MRKISTISYDNTIYDTNYGYAAIHKAMTDTQGAFISNVPLLSDDK